MELRTICTLQLLPALLALGAILPALATAARKPTPTPKNTPSATATPTPLRNATPTPPPPGGLSVAITNPAPGETIGADRYNVRGTFQGPPNTGLTVNNLIAYTDAGRFIADNVPLTAGQNTLTVVATAPDGTSTTTAVTVNASGAPPNPSLIVDASKGFAPLSVTFNYAFSSGSGLKKVAIDFDGDGRDDFRTTNPPGPSGSVQNTYSEPGLYLAVLTITDIFGGVHKADIGIQVAAFEALDALFLSVWNRMNDALLRGDVGGALACLNSRAQEKYARVFSDLLVDMPAIVASYSIPQRVSAGDNYFEYAVNRTIDGENQIFFVYLLRDADGVWRMDSL
jgi:glucodextranase-like protein